MGTEDSNWRRERRVAMRATESSSSDVGVEAFVGGDACFVERVDLSRAECEEFDEADERIEVVAVEGGSEGGLERLWWVFARAERREGALSIALGRRGMACGITTRKISGDLRVKMKI